MADYNNLRERVDLYVKRTGLPRATVNAFRKTPTKEFSSARDRRIGGAIRGLERLWRDPELSVELWLRIARGVLRAIRDFFNDTLTTVVQLGKRLAKVIGRALLWAERTVERIDAFIDRHPRLLKAFEVVASAVKAAAAARTVQQFNAQR